MTGRPKKLEDDVQTTIRFPGDIITRADALLLHPELSSLNLNRSQLLRTAVVEGLRVLETRYPKPSSKRAAK